MADSVVEVLLEPASVVEVFQGIPGAPGADAEGGGAVESVNGATGVVVLGKSDVGLGSVDNTADADKPVSTAQATALAGKASTAHTHSESDVTGLTAALAAKADAAATTSALAGKAATSHTHTESDVTGLTAALAGKSSTGHTHTAANVTDFAAAVAAVELSVVAGSANNPHTTQAASRNASLPKNFWQYTGTAGVDDPDNWTAGDEWISA